MDKQPPSSQQIIGQLFEQNYGWLCARLRGFLGCRYNAEDIAAETFVRVLTLPDPGDIREPRALLTTISRRLMQESWRRRDLEQAYLAILREQPEQIQTSPEEHALLIETLVRLDNLLDGLPGQGKAAFVHSQLGGMSYTQTAEHLGLSLSRVQQYMTEAFKLCYRAQYE